MTSPTLQLARKWWATSVKLEVRSGRRDPSSVSLRLPPSPAAIEKDTRATGVGMDRLYTDVETHTAEAARPFGLVEEHRDGVVVGVE